MKKRPFHYTILTILALAILIPHTYAYNTQSDCSNTNWYFITYNTYLFCQSGQTLYADSISNLGTYANFTNAAFNPNQNPERTFGVGSQYANTTIQTIANLYTSFAFSNFQTGNSTAYLFYYYPSSANNPNEVDVQQGAQDNIIGSANFYTTLAGFNAAQAPAVLLNISAHYLEVKSTYQGAVINVYPNSIEVTLTLSLADTSKILNATNYFILSYVKGGSSTSIHALDGANIFYADPLTSFSISSASTKSNSNLRWCVISCSQSATSGSTSSLSLTWDYYTQYNVSMKWVKPDTNSFAQQIPYVTFTSFGSSIKDGMNTAYITYWMDNQSTWSVTNPFYYDNFARVPSPATGTVTAAALVSVTFTQSALPVSNDPFKNLMNGQILLGALGPFINLMGLENFLGMLLIAIDFAVFLKSNNSWLFITLLLVEGAVFVGANGTGGIQTVLPSYFNVLSYALLGLGIAGSVFKVYSTR